MTLYIHNRTSQWDTEISFISIQGAAKIVLFSSWYKGPGRKRRTLTCSWDAGCFRDTWSNHWPWWPCVCTGLHTPPYYWNKRGDIALKRSSNNIRCLSLLQTRWKYNTLKIVFLVWWGYFRDSSSKMLCLRENIHRRIQSISHYCCWKISPLIYWDLCDVDVCVRAFLHGYFDTLNGRHIWLLEE